MTKQQIINLIKAQPITEEATLARREGRGNASDLISKVSETEVDVYSPGEDAERMSIERAADIFEGHQLYEI